jgi:hypothetical protein
MNPMFVASEIATNYLRPVIPTQLNLFDDENKSNENTDNNNNQSNDRLERYRLVMEQCWMKEQSERPSFGQLQRIIAEQRR